jgi:Zn-dependent protease
MVETCGRDWKGKATRRQAGMSRRHTTLTRVYASTTLRADAPPPAHPGPLSVDLDHSTLIEIVETIPVLLFAFVAHEWGHAYAALKQGDPTALNAGRLTFNPIVHIDPFRTIILPAVLLFMGAVAVGGAKPCPVNPSNFRSYRRSDIIVSLAGVAMNALVAIGSTMLFLVIGVIGHAFPEAGGALTMLQEMLQISVTYNLLLLFLNLLPIPGFDGGHVLVHFLPANAAMSYRRLEGVSLIFLFALVSFAGGLFALLISPAFLLRDVLMSPVLHFALGVQ